MAKYAVNCQLSNKPQGRDQERIAKGKWMFYQELKAVNYNELIWKVFMHVQKSTCFSTKYRN